VTITGLGAAADAAAPTIDTTAFTLLTRAYCEAIADDVADMLPSTRQMHARIHKHDPLARIEWSRIDVAHRVRLSPGVIALEVKWPRPDDVTEQGWRDDAESIQRQRLAELWPDEEEPDEVPSRGVITHWSARSRRNMIRRLAMIDHDSWKEPAWRLSMVTLTLPDDWQAVCPTGAAWKAAFDRFRGRWLREFGWWQCAWKQEFQRRGAPHMHLMTRVPDDGWRSSRGENFMTWLSRAWADVIDADRYTCRRCGVGCDCPRPDTEFRRHLAAGTNVDFGFRGTDPKRIAIYFLKHSAKSHDGKEYQHIVPDEWQQPGTGPGRFWGIAGLASIDVVIDLDRWAWVVVKRVLRHWHRANRSRIALARRARAISGLSEQTRRQTLLDLRAFGARRDRVLSHETGGGWVVVGDAPALLHQIARYARCRE